MDNCKPNYYAVVPADVRYDDSLPANAKLLYGEISALIGADGFCYATNQYFSRLYGMSDETISRLLAKLEKAGHITRQLTRDASGQIVQRKIYLRVSSCDAHPLDEKINTSPQKSQGGIDKKVKENNTSNTVYIADNSPNDGERPPKKDRRSKKEPYDPTPAFARFVFEHIGDNDAGRAVYAALLNFADHRKAIKKPIPSQASVTALLNKLLKHSEGYPSVMIDMLDTAVSSCWQTVYPPKSRVPSPAASSPVTPPDPADYF